VELRHGHPVADPYRWLENPADPQTADWMAAQDELFKTVQGRWTGRPWLRGRVAGLMSAGRLSTPVSRGSRLFMTRREPGQEHPVLIMIDGDRETVLVDPALIDPSGRTVLEAWQPSWEGTLLAYQLSEAGAEDALLRVLDVGTGANVDGPIDRVRRSAIGWLAGGRKFCYVRRLPPEQVPPGEERYHRRVYLHEVGADPAHDTVIFGAGGAATQFYSVSVSSDGRWLTVAASRGAAPRRDIWLADLSDTRDPAPLLRPVQVGVDALTRAHLAAGRSGAPAVYLRTDRDAPRGRLMIADAADPAEHWRELVAEDPEAVLTDFALLGGPLLERPLVLVSRSRHGVSEVAVHDLADGRRVATVPLPGIGSIGHLETTADPGHQAWFSYSDYATSPTILRYDARTGRTQRWLVPAGAINQSVITRQVTFSSADGTLVRMFVLSSSGHPDRPRPAILTGYGGFGASMTPECMPNALAWVEAGGIFAVACLRGGGEEGASWHRAGMREGRHRVFEDFHAAARFLTEGGWTAPDQLGVLGSSNGGLLAGVALTQHPEQYAAVACLAPLLDMARYELSGMGPSWRDEYGSTQDPVQFASLLAYSPYHRVRTGIAYPATMLAIFEGDTRVDPLHARKMCAALQHASVGDAPIVLRAERGVGHGVRAMSSGAALLADVLAFFAHELGLEVPGDDGA
jgi:prolyl oligopeptidase